MSKNTYPRGMESRTILSKLYPAQATYGNGCFGCVSMVALKPDPLAIWVFGRLGLKPNLCLGFGSPQDYQRDVERFQQKRRGTEPNLLSVFGKKAAKSSGDFRGPAGHIDRSILQTVLPGIPLVLGLEPDCRILMFICSFIYIYVLYPQPYLHVYRYIQSILCTSLVFVWSLGPLHTCPA